MSGTIVGTHRYYHSDALGSTRVVTDDAGAPVSAYSYDAYGAVRAQAGEGRGLTYTGEQPDTETGMVFLRARTYDPTTGRFLQRDTEAGRVGDPRTLNRYGYAGGNPLRYTDPTGHIIETAWDAANVAWDMYEVSQDPSPLNVAALVVDVGATLIPFVPGGAGLLVRGGKAASQMANHAGEAIRAGEVASSVARQGEMCPAVAARIYAKREVLGRTVYQREIDWGFRDPMTGLTNLERAKLGRPPIGSDGMPVNLHHLLQEEPGPVAEVLQSTHQSGYSALHTLRNAGKSFRNDVDLEKQYNRYRAQY